MVIIFVASSAFAQNEQAPIIERDIDFKNWIYKSVRSDEDVNLRKFAIGKKFVMVVYFAPWCPNWKHDAAFVQGLYEKYSPNGFEVIGVGEYDPIAAMKAHLDAYKITFPVVYESVLRTDKQKTLHYGYRKKTGDTRNWGSPWYIFLDPSRFERGELLVSRTSIVNGELIKEDAETFIRGKLGLSTEPVEIADRRPIEP